MLKIVGKLGHLCPFNQGRLTDEHSAWIIHCRCRTDGEHLRAQDEMAVRLDAGAAKLPDWVGVRK